MNEHTPTPWVLAGSATIKGADKEWIATVGHWNRAANAAFIVRAVNAHDDMLKALRHALGYVASAGVATDWAREELHTEITEAIAKAEGRF